MSELTKRLKQEMSTSYVFIKKDELATLVSCVEAAESAPPVIREQQIPTEVRCCETCKHDLLSVKEEPCVRCLSYSEWEKDGFVARRYKVTCGECRFRTNLGMCFVVRDTVLPTESCASGRHRLTLREQKIISIASKTLKMIDRQEYNGQLMRHGFIFAVELINDLANACERNDND